MHNMKWLKFATILNLNNKIKLNDIARILAPIIFILCGHVYDYVTLYGQRDFANVIKVIN